MAVVETDALTKYYGDTRGIKDLDLVVEPGEVFGFLGPNGAGKTTTIRTLLGFVSPTSGSATVLGRDVTDRAALRAARRRIGYVPGALGFDDDVTGNTFLDYQERLKGASRRDELADIFTPPLARPIGEYSRGNEQKLAIVQAFMHDPDLVVMDEPTSGLDPLLQERFYEFVRQERAAGTTVFFSSHVLGEVRKVCDRVAILRDGHLVELTPVEELLGRGGRLVRVRLAEPVDAVPVDGVQDPTYSDGRRSVAFTFTGAYDALVDWLADRSVLDLEVEEPPLEEVFLHYYGDGPAERAGGDTADGREEVTSADPEAGGRRGTADDGARPSGGGTDA
jgi:ABC-2 type transport system ATP-binding protein